MKVSLQFCFSHYATIYFGWEVVIARHSLHSILVNCRKLMHGQARTSLSHPLGRLRVDFRRRHSVRLRSSDGVEVGSLVPTTSAVEMLFLVCAVHRRGLVFVLLSIQCVAICAAECEHKKTILSITRGGVGSPFFLVYGYFTLWVFKFNRRALAIFNWQYRVRLCTHTTALGCVLIGLDCLLCHSCHRASLERLPARLRRPRSLELDQQRSLWRCRARKPAKINGCVEPLCAPSETQWQRRAL